MIENCHKNLKNVFMKFESPLIKNSEWKMFLYKEGNVIFFFFEYVPKSITWILKK